MKARPIVRPATKADITHFSDGPAPTLRGWVAELDGELIAIAGFARFTGKWLLFMDIKDRARDFPVTMVRWGKRLMEEADKQKIQFLYASAEKCEPMAEKWLSSLGFVEDPRAEDLLIRRGA